MNSDSWEDLRIGPEILKLQAELYWRVRNTLRWLLGSLDGFTDAEAVPFAELPELERWVLHRLTEFDFAIRSATETYQWTGVYPALHAFCATDLSAFYFDIRKDAIYCDRPDSPRRRAARTVLDQLHRCLAIWLAPVLCFTAEEAWCARFGDESSAHLQTYPALPAEWADPALAARWEAIREKRRAATVEIEAMRQRKEIGSSLEVAVTLGFEPGRDPPLGAEEWAEVIIVSAVRLEAGGDAVRVRRVEHGGKCARCWRVLEEVGSDARHPTLCLRCSDAVESGLVCRAAA
jgi:isoleucyl-tRNA synthetase